MAEWSKALASGASPQGRGFEPHSCHLSYLFSDGYDGDVCIATQNKEKLQQMVPRGLEPRTLRLLAVRSNQLSYETSDYRVPRSSSTLWLLTLIVRVVSCSLSWIDRARCRGDIAFVVVVASCSLSALYRARCWGCSVPLVVVASCSVSWLHRARCHGCIVFVVVVVSYSLSGLHRTRRRGCVVIVFVAVSCSLA